MSWMPGITTQKIIVVCRPEMVVGWYHSHPGFGCWLSGVDINTQQVGMLSIDFNSQPSRELILHAKSNVLSHAEEPACEI